MNIGKVFKRIFNPRPIVGYVSTVDKFLEEFDKTHKPSLSQRQEIKKYQRIEKLRDNPIPKDLQSKIWEEF